MSSLYSYLSSPASTQASIESQEFSGESGGSGFLLFVFVFYIDFALLHVFLYCPHQRQVSIDYRRSRVLRWAQHIDFPLKAGFALSRHSTPLASAPLEVCARLIGGRAPALFHQILCRQAIKLGSKTWRRQICSNSFQALYEQRWKWKYTLELSFSLPPADSLLRHRQQILCSTGSLNLLCLNDKG